MGGGGREYSAFGRTLGSPFSGYMSGDYDASIGYQNYYNSRWQAGLRRYPYSPQEAGAGATASRRRASPQRPRSAPRGAANAAATASVLQDRHRQLRSMIREVGSGGGGKGTP